MGGRNGNAVAEGLILDGEQAVPAPVSRVGGKASRLARLAGAGLPVPEFFVITSEALSLHLEANRIAVDRGGEPTGAVREKALGDAVTAASMPQELAEKIIRAYQDLFPATGGGSVAVRSSGAEEDSTAASFAGRFASRLGVGSPEGLIHAVKQCWASNFSDPVLQYRFALGARPHHIPGLAVIVQIQIFSERAGVLFTVHPLEPQTLNLYLEANFGTGESVVGGLVTPDALTLSRSSGEVLKADIATKRFMTRVSPDSNGSRLVEVQESLKEAPVLGEEQIRNLVTKALYAEELLGGPQDLEWAFDARGLWILQSRPITAAGGPS